MSSLSSRRYNPSALHNWMHIHTNNNNNNFFLWPERQPTKIWRHYYYSPMLTLQGCTSFLASTFCAGSPRKLIAGLWYTIVANAIILTIICIYIINVRSSAEEFDCIWAALTLCALVVGGTMVMRSYHSSMAIGFFLGAVVGSSCLFFLLFLLWVNLSWLICLCIYPMQLILPHAEWGRYLLFTLF